MKYLPLVIALRRGVVQRRVDRSTWVKCHQVWRLYQQVWISFSVQRESNKDCE